MQHGLLTGTGRLNRNVLEGERLAAHTSHQYPVAIVFNHAHCKVLGTVGINDCHARRLRISTCRAHPLIQVGEDANAISFR